MEEKMINKKNFKLIRSLRWEEVFLFWYQSEGTQQNWINLAKQRGFASWADWRLTSYGIPFECAKADWNLYEIFNPAQIIPKFYGGPFKTWIKRYYGGAKEKTFEQLAVQPDILNNEAVKSMIDNFPGNKIISCLQVGNKIYTIEGLHRCCALAVVNAQNKPAPKKLYFAIGKSSLKNLPIVGRVDA